MKSTAVWALIALNAVLLGSFVCRLLPENTAIAQRAAVPQRGDYLIIPANFNGVSSGILVIVDQTNSQLSAATFDEGNNKVEMMPKIDLKQVFSSGPVTPANRGARRGL